jgi:hypothetical protein
VIALTAPACSAVNHRVIRTDHSTFSIVKDSHTELAVTTFNGNVNVTAIGPGTADVSVTPYGTGVSSADAQAALETVQVASGYTGSTLTVTATASGDAPPGGSRGADVDVQVPPDTSVSVSTSNGHVEVVNVEGSVTVRTTNAAVATRGGVGVDVETSNGAVVLTRPTGSITVITSNAASDVLDAREASARIETSNGSIGFSGRLAAGSHAFTSSNAAITLRLPPDQGFTIDAATGNASATTDFPGLTSGGGSIQGSVGDGSAQITARTANGQIRVTQLRP